MSEYSRRASPGERWRGPSPLAVAPLRTAGVEEARNPPRSKQPPWTSSSLAAVMSLAVSNRRVSAALPATATTTSIAMEGPRSGRDDGREEGW